MCLSRLETAHSPLRSEITEYGGLAKFGHLWENPFNNLCCKFLPVVGIYLKVAGIFQFDHSWFDVFVQSLETSMRMGICVLGR